MNKTTKFGSYLGTMGAFLMILVLMFKLSSPNILFTILLLSGLMFLVAGLIVMVIGQLIEISDAITTKNYALVLILISSLIFSIYKIFFS